MAWLDDDYPRHIKIEPLTDRAFRTHTTALCYCSKYGTGGYLEPVLSTLRPREKVVEELVKAGLWDREPDGLWIHDWEKHNEKRDDALEARRQADRERQQRHRDRVRSRDNTPTSRYGSRDSHVSGHVTDRDSERDSSVTETVTPLAGARPRARVGPRPNDHDHDQEHPSGRQNPDLDHPAAANGPTSLPALEHILEDV